MATDNMPTSPLKWNSEKPVNFMQECGTKRKADLAPQSHWMCESEHENAVIFAKKRCFGLPDQARGVTVPSYFTEAVTNGDGRSHSLSTNLTTPETTCFETNSGNSAFSGQENSIHDDDNSESGMEVDSLVENQEPLLKTESEVKIPMTGIEHTTGGSNRMRCYCRPSWDALMFDQPFVSDYY